MRRKKGEIDYDDDTIQMLDNIDLQPTSNFSSKSSLINNEEVFPVNSLKRALNVSLEKKCLKIERFLEHNSSNLHNHLSQLYSFATSHDGLVKDAYREKIWPILAENIAIAPKIVKDEKKTLKRGKTKLQDEEASTSSSEDSDFESALSTFSFSSQINGLQDEFSEQLACLSMEELRYCKDWNQVELDVNRTLARFPPNINDEERKLLQIDLIPLIVQIMWENPKFSYYQGFHDICLTLILVMGKEQALKAARCLTRRAQFYNYLSSTLEESAMTELQDVYVLLYLNDPDVEQHMRLAELGVLFALSWPLTWFSHDLQHYSQIVVFFDLFLSSHHMMPIYVSAALISARREEVLQCEAEMPMLHQLLNHVPPNINVNKVLDSARLMFARFPPSLVKGEYKREYEKMCARQRRQRLAVARLQQRIPPPGTLPRNNLSPWLVAGTAVSAVAVYLWVARTINPVHMF